MLVVVLDLEDVVRSKRIFIKDYGILFIRNFFYSIFFECCFIGEIIYFFRKLVVFF